MSGFVRDAVAGLVASLLPLANCFTFAALIFTGPWQPFLGQGVAALLVTGAVTASVVALTSSFRTVVAGPISATSALLAAMLASLGPAMAGQPPAVVLATAYAGLGAATLVTGATLLALGCGRLGKLVRFVPYPVVAGFMGATGWVMITGAVHMSTDLPLALQSLPSFAEVRAGLLLVGVVAWAGVLSLLTRRFRHTLTIPAALAAATLATDAALRASGTPFVAARASGLLFDVAGAVSPRLPLASGALRGADWTALGHAAGHVLPVAVVGVLGALLTATSIELTLGAEADLDRELRAQGTANVVSALLGGVLGFVSTSYTLVNRDAGGRGRASGVVVGLVALATLVGGAGVVSYIPRFVLGGLLLMLGAKLFWDWGVASRRKMPLREWLLTVAIIVISAALGFLLALLCGVIGGCVILAFNMSRLGVVRRRCGINERPSSLLRPEREMLVLAEHGASVQVLELGGFIFFGSAYQLYEQVKAIVASGKVHLLILDVSAVIGIDSSAAAILGRAGSLSRKAGARLAVAGLDAAVAQPLQRAGGLGPSVARHASPDEAIEAAENEVLARQGQAPAASRTMQEWLSGALGSADLAQELVAHLKPACHPEGDCLCRQGEATDTLHFIERGRVSVVVERPGQAAMRVRAFGQHTIAGELGFFLCEPRTATLLVEEEASVGSLSREDFHHLSAKRPELVLALLNYLVRVQSERLSFATRQITALRR